MNSLCRCGCSRLAGLYWHGTSLGLCSLLSQWAAILCKHSTIPAMMPHYVPVETYSPPFADQWMQQHTSWRWEHNETADDTMSRWYILNSVRAQGLLGSMDNEPYFLKKNFIYIMSASFHYSEATFALISPYYISNFENTLCFITSHSSQIWVWRHQHWAALKLCICVL